MSMEMREWVVNHPHTHFSDEISDHADLLDPTITQTNLIAMIVNLLNLNHIIYFTAIKSDHSDDGYLGLNCHYNGYCIDCWPMVTDAPGDYYNVSDLGFLSFLQDASNDPHYYQIGLTPDCYNSETTAVAGDNVYLDDGASHVHIGVI
jgi:hypothetical protein